MIVNKYITALLVALAATGMEAQTYQQALRFALADITYDEFIQQPEAKALEEDILHVIKAIKQASEEDDKAPAFPYVCLTSQTAETTTDNKPYLSFAPQADYKYQAPYGSIVIRGPDR